MRKYRKQEHIDNFLKAKHQGNTLFDDIFLSHNALPEMNFDEVDTRVSYLGKPLEFPLMINAMTGGTEFTYNINRDLGALAHRFKLPIAVGSMTILKEDDDARSSFTVVREENPHGIILGNLNAFATAEDAKRAVDVLEGDGLQIHLNPGQELIQEEGDRQFYGVLKNIERLVQSVEVPIIVKEVGFGLSPQVIESLYGVGVRHVDLSGFGGTNFFEVENMRLPHRDYSELFNWGIPTAYGLIRAKELDLEGLHITSSGGIRQGLDVVKSLVLGADLVAMSGEILSYLVHGNLDYASEYLEDLIHKVKIIMTLLGAKNIPELSQVPWKATGKLRDLLEGREY
ncbi:MAG: type 2 isopentenyl-diphosphate Delta-isomerase [Tissierellia bacterium]|nr:type 2 isopentenyl-diphosphate Delta-isomerase [Tissierellia bacterium]